MKLPAVPHRWNLRPRTAIAVQMEVAKSVREAPLLCEPRLIVGLDAAFSPDGRHCIAGAVVWDRATLAVVEHYVVWRKARFPYVPGLLSFREGPAVLAVLRRLRRQPDLLICDGQGRAHPRRCGIASHIGVVADLPTIGCAKSRLVGTFVEPGPSCGDSSPLVTQGEQVGIVLRTKLGCNPLYVSVGHRITLAEAQAAVLTCVLKHRLPEPTRLADQLVSRHRLEVPVLPTPRPG